MKEVAWRNLFLSGLRFGVRECGRRRAFLDERDSKVQRHHEQGRGMGWVKFYLDRGQGGSRDPCSRGRRLHDY